MPTRDTGTSGPPTLGDPRIDLLWRLLDKSAGRRANYANRASVIIAASALLAAAVIVLLQEPSRPLEDQNTLVTIGSILALLTILGSLLYGLLAIINLRPKRTAREVVPYPKDGPRRLFVSPSDTFHRFPPPNLEDFLQALYTLTPSDVMEILGSELYIDMQFQRRRFKKLQVSAILLASAAGLVIALLALRLLEYIWS